MPLAVVIVHEGDSWLLNKFIITSKIWFMFTCHLTCTGICKRLSRLSCCPPKLEIWAPKHCLICIYSISWSGVSSEFLSLAVPASSFLLIWGWICTTFFVHVVSDKVLHPGCTHSSKLECKKCPSARVTMPRDDKGAIFLEPVLRPGQVFLVVKYVSR